MAEVTTSCGKLASNMLADFCNKAPVGGIKDVMYLIPFDDVDKKLSTLDPANPLLITSLVMKTAKNGYKVVGHNYSNELMCEMVKGAIFDRWTHTVPFKVLEDSVGAKKWVDSAKNTKVIVVLEKYHASTNSANAFEVAGFDCGLDIASASINFSDADSKGAFVITFATNEKSLEPYPTRNYLSTDYATTKTALEALLPTGA